MSNRTKGILAIVSSAFGFALMALFVRLCDSCGGPVSSFQKGFFRNVVALTVAAVAFGRSQAAPGGTGRERSPVRPALRLLGGPVLCLLSLRALLGTVGIFSNFYALSHVTIAEGQTLNKTAPFFTILFAWLLLGERVGRRQVTALLLAFGGILLIAKPGFAGAQAFPLAIGLLGGACAGGAYACVRALRRRGVPTTLVILFFSVFSCLASVPFMLVRFDPMTFRQLLVLLGAGVGAAIGQFGITLAYGYSAPRDIAVFDYSNVLFTAAFGCLFFAQVPDLLSVLGFVAILLAVLRQRPADG